MQDKFSIGRRLLLAVPVALLPMGETAAASTVVLPAAPAGKVWVCVSETAWSAFLAAIDALGSGPGLGG